MRACSKSDAGALLAGAATVVLGVFFWVPAWRGTVNLMPPASLEGKDWVLRDPAPQPRAPAPASAPPEAVRPVKEPADVAMPTQKIRATGQKGRNGRKPSPPAPAPDKRAADEGKPTAPPEAKAASPVALNSVAATEALDSLHAYSMQDLIDGFEADPSKYPLDRTVRSDGISVSLEGLQCRDKLVVLKLAVANSRDADFFIKDFTVRAGPTILGSRSLFRILVEPQRVREGYVLFEKPQPGAAVQIQLKEDSGKGRSIETGVPYRF